MIISTLFPVAGFGIISYFLIVEKHCIVYMCPIFCFYSSIISTFSLLPRLDYCTLLGQDCMGSQALSLTLPSMWQNIYVMPPNYGQIHDPEGALPSTSTKIESRPLKLLTFNTPQRSSGWKLEMGHSALQKKNTHTQTQTCRRGCQIVDTFGRRCLWPLILVSSQTWRNTNITDSDSHFGC